MTTPTPAPRTWLDRDLVTATRLNTEMRNALEFLISSCQTTAQRSTAQSIPSGTETAIVWDSILDDVDNLISPPASVFTFTRSGVIAVKAKVTFDNTSGLGGFRRILAQYKPVGGSWAYIGAFSDGSPPQYPQLPFALEFPVAVGDQFRLLAYQASGSSINLTDGGSYVVLRWASATGEWMDYDIPDPGPEPGESTPPATEPTEYTKTYTATWSRTYDGAGDTTSGDTKYCYQGYSGDKYAGIANNLRSLVGFSYTTIKADLVGAVNISATLTFRIVQCKQSNLTVIIGAHNYASKPSTWTNANVDQDQKRQGSCIAGKTYTVELPAAIVHGLQTGQYKGIAFGPGPTTSYLYYGWLDGATCTNPPKLVVTYYK